MWIVFILLMIEVVNVRGQYYHPQNATNQPIQQLGPPNGVPAPYPFSYPSPYGLPIGPPIGPPPGLSIGPPPQPLPYTNGGYPGFGYPPPPQQYPFYPQGYGYPLPYQQGMVGGNPAGFGQIGLPYPQQSVGSTSLDQNIQTSLNDNITAEILDVSPEYQRQLLGWPPESAPSRMQVSKPRYTVDIDTQTSNHTNVPTNLTKPIVTEKKYTTSIKRTFVYDPSKSDQMKPINIHIVNGQQVTTTPPPATTESEDVQGITSWYEENSV